MRYKILKPNPYARLNNLLSEMIDPAFHLTLLREIDVTPLQLIRAKYAKTGSGNKPSFTALIAKASARALAIHPYANRVLLNGLRGPRLAQFEQAHVSIGVSLDAPGQEQAAYVGHLEACDQKTLLGTTEELRQFSPDHPGNEGIREKHRRMAARTPAWLLRPFISWSRYFAPAWLSWCRSALIISSPGKVGADAIFSTWPWPIGLSFGMIRLRPFEVDSKLSLRSTTKLTMVADRRIMAGVAATRFLNTICEGLQKPALLELEEDFVSGNENINARSPFLSTHRLERTNEEISV